MRQSFGSEPIDGRQPIIEMRHGAKTFAQGQEAIHALVDISLEVARGEFLAIMGTSGSGKSTLLHVLGGLESLDAGTLRIGGRNLPGMTDDELTLFRRQHVGFVFQGCNLLPSLSAEENVQLPFLLAGKRPRDVRAIVDEMLSLVGLWHRRAHRPAMLSGGEMQRVAIARAMVTRPTLLLADEPTGMLDRRTSSGILSLLKSMGSALTQTIVMVTHDTTAAAFGDRIVSIEDGRLVGDPS